MPTAQPSSIPSSRLSPAPTPPEPPALDKITIEISRRDHNHETRIIDQLFAAPFSVTQETPPGASIGSNSKSDTGRVSDANDYRTNLARATGGGWKSWRLEMKQAGIPTWDSIKPTSDIVTTPPSAPAAIHPRTNAAAWGRPSDNCSSGGGLDAPTLQKPTSNAIQNPTPLPLDPTLHTFRRQRQSQAGSTYNSQPTIKNSTGWWRSMAQSEGQKSHPTAQQGQPVVSVISENSSRSTPESILSERPARTEVETPIAAHAPANGIEPSTDGKELIDNAQSNIESGSCLTPSGLEALPTKEAKQHVELHGEEIHGSIPDRGIPSIREAEALPQNGTAPLPSLDVSSRLGEDAKTQPMGKVGAPLDARIDGEETWREGVQTKRMNQPEPETASAKKRWWSLPWQK
ncbi:hypothetical protein TWF481_001546 [Arthrobotrys musiformis]